MQIQKNKPAFRVSQGVNADYKTRRLQSWSLQAHDWDEYTKENPFHVRSHDRICSEVLTLLQKQPIEAKLANPEAKKKPSPCPFIDFGCGSGRFLRLIKEKSEEPWGKLVGIDFCDQMLNLANGIDSNYSNRVRWHRADLELPIAQTAIYSFTNFDIATAVFLLDEIENIQACFESARCVLRPGGAFVCGMLDPEREKERYHLPNSVQHTFTIARPTTIAGERLAGEYFRLVRPMEQIFAAASSCGLTRSQDITVRPSELGTSRDGPILRIIIWNNHEDGRRKV